MNKKIWVLQLRRKVYSTIILIKTFFKLFISIYLTSSQHTGENISRHKITSAAKEF